MSPHNLVRTPPSKYESEKPVAPWQTGHSETGPITIHKLKESAQDPVKGATFTVTPVNKVGGKTVDLNTIDGWKTLAH